jgi:phosphatidylserine/phosphatidylglycerophosphate/cardiolipin synthase-like enzyme
MTLANPQWLIDGSPATSFVFGRTAVMAVDVSQFAGGQLTFKLYKDAAAPALRSWSVSVPATGNPPVTIKVPVQLTYQWPVLTDTPTTFSLVDESCKAGATRPYPTNSWFLADPITDDLLFPPLHFTVAEPGQPPSASPVIRRAMPQFVGGNKVELLVDGDEILPSVLAALAGAKHHVHLNWFFFAPDAIGTSVEAALILCASRGVEVRLMFDIPATLVPEPLGQGAGLLETGAMLGLLDAAGVKLASSSMLIPPFDDRLNITDREYGSRHTVQQLYALGLAARHGAPVALHTVKDIVEAGTEPMPGRRFQRILRWLGKDLNALGSAGIGTPVLLGGCRDHSKLIIVDGQVAFCGGPNCHRYYLYQNAIDPTMDAKVEMNATGNTEKWLKWHDCFARYEGPAVRDAQRYFLERWAVSSGEYLSRTSADYFPAPTNVGTAEVKVINNVPGLERDIAAEYLRMFRNSQQKILIVNPYVTDDLLATYLAHAAKVRNVPAELIVPDKYLDFTIARELMKARWDSLRAAGVAIHAYETHMNHVKVATADGIHSIVSSYNLAKSSAAQLFECGIAVRDTAFAAEVEQRLIDVDRAVSQQVTASTGTDWKTFCSGDIPMRFLDRIV